VRDFNQHDASPAAAPLLSFEACPAHGGQQPGAAIAAKNQVFMTGGAGWKMAPQHGFCRWNWSGLILTVAAEMARADTDFGLPSLQLQGSISEREQTPEPGSNSSMMRCGSGQ
jgi:hypothetical protein